MTASPTSIPTPQCTAGRVGNCDVDVLIVGGGMVGTTLAAALGNADLSVGLVEMRSLHDISYASPESGADGRSSALALGTTRMLDAIDIWPIIARAGVSPIHRIQVSDGNFSRVVQLRREDIDARALGYVVPNQTTQAALVRHLKTCSNVQLFSPARVEAVSYEVDAVTITLQHNDRQQSLRASLLVAADGANSRLRQQAGIPVSRWHYHQACIVTTVTTERPHHQVAYERFQPSGPFAILPMHAEDHEANYSHRSCVVWTVSSHDRDRLMTLDDRKFIEAITPWFGPQLGRIVSASPRASYIPYRSHSRTYTQPRLALVGDAAHSTHPVGGQGVNLGMRDVAALAEVIVQAFAHQQDIGQLEVLARYERWRRLDNSAVLFATDTANRLFSNQWWPVQWTRRLGLISLGLLSPLKRWLMLRAMGLGGKQPQLVNGKPLTAVSPPAQSSHRSTQNT